MRGRPVPEGCPGAVRTSEGPIARVIHRELAWHGRWRGADLVRGSPTAAPAGAACSCSGPAAIAVSLETIGGGFIAEQLVFHPFSNA